ncbi:Hypothetical-Protein / belonging to T4-LIKE GC: 781 [Synechococcus phage S-PM2]|uniref:Hypothetical-Protein belonging to T4-LIKE GC: 781 n=1 Tax=Synechococcus phage S-PM2 TaxID=238854 RepID=Q5GQQ2_BPSYP|nr:Hypothetical-Protein / belonging to T4-LIKE GC: 781 [Synechococcus phage S-PM2]CAF34100.1 Hypothetical-Protein / belonging to T4-LIKE GC: 781 [Synechococcus phage S-PM2]
MKKPEFPKPRIIREGLLPEQDTIETNPMIDLSQLNVEQLKELELQIQKHKEQQEHKNILKNLQGYKVTFYIRFDPEKHKDHDMLTNKGKLDPNIFADYLCDNLVTDLIRNFELYGYEDVNYPTVEVATRQEIEGKF